MVKTKKSKENVPDKTRLKIKKKYEKKFLWFAIALCFCQIKYKLLSAAADFIFSGKKQKMTKLLLSANKAVGKSICKCQTLAEKCEYYQNKIKIYS